LAPLQKVAGQLNDCLRRKPQDGQPEVVVAGRPNVGKSSLVNALARRPVSIVTDEAGTTRDAVSTDVLLDSWRVRLVDTAGRQFDEQPKEQEDESLAARAASRVAAERTAGASLVVWVGDRLQDMKGDSLQERPGLWVMNKADLLGPDRRQVVEAALKEQGALLVSARTGDGLQQLSKQIAQNLDELMGPADGIPVSVRQAEAVRKLLEHIENAINNMEGDQTELVAEDLRGALHALGQLRGETVSTDVLDRIFETFCVGK
jgi:tRNA modification GTPase